MTRPSKQQVIDGKWHHLYRDWHIAVIRLVIRGKQRIPSFIGVNAGAGKKASRIRADWLPHLPGEVKNGDLLAVIQRGTDDPHIFTVFSILPLTLTKTQAQQFSRDILSAEEEAVMNDINFTTDPVMLSLCVAALLNSTKRGDPLRSVFPPEIADELEGGALSALLKTDLRGDDRRQHLSELWSETGENRYNRLIAAHHILADHTGL